MVTFAVIFMSIGALIIIVLTVDMVIDIIKMKKRGL